MITGGVPLKGEVTISGAKNAAVAILPAVILSDEVCRLENVPNISDTAAILRIMQELGADVRYIQKNTVEIDPRPIRSHTVTYEMTNRMRASSYFIGSILGRFHKALVAPPGGCNFGVRPIDQHIKGFEALGARVSITHGMVSAEADRLIGCPVYLDVVSVGATINIMLAAVKARGLTVIENAAREPHIVDLANFLNSMGADIMGAGTDVIKIRGVEHLGGACYSIIPDQIEAGTYMVAAAATGGNVLVKNVIPKHLGIHHRQAGGTRRHGGGGGRSRPGNRARPSPPLQCQDHAAPRLSDRYAAADSHPPLGGGRDKHRHRRGLGQPLPVMLIS